MLVLARKLDESIVINEDITVKIISIEKGVVKLGIDAPKDITVIRNELLEDVKDSNVSASKACKLDDLSQLSKIIKK